MGPKSHPKSSAKRQSVADTVGQGQHGDWATGFEHQGSVLRPKSIELSSKKVSGQKVLRDQKKCELMQSSVCVAKAFFKEWL